MTKPVISGSVPEELKEKVDEYKEENGYSRSEAIRNLLKTGIEVETSDKAVLPVDAIADGGQVKEEMKQEVEEEVSGIRQTLDKQEKDQRLQNGMVLVGIVWVAIQTAIGLGTLATVATGVPLFAVGTWLLFNSLS